MNALAFLICLALVASAFIYDTLAGLALGVFVVAADQAIAAYLKDKAE